MSGVLVDTNILIDVTTRNPAWAEWSRHQLVTLGSIAPLIINQIIFAEFSVGFDKIEDVDDCLAPDKYRREPLPYEAGFLAGKAFVAYRLRGGLKSAPIPDFYIGAHAICRGYRLLTRDASRYRTCFPDIDLIAPDIIPLPK